jgi:hypothetical protein
MAALATPRLFVLWDRDQATAGVGMISGVDSTMENSNSWTSPAGTTGFLTTAVSHAGERSQAVARTSTTGTASASWTGQAGDTVAGRTYLWCAYLRPDTTARVATMSVDFRTAGGGSSAGTASASLTEVAGRWLELLLVAVAPAGASFPILTLSYPGVVAGELHYSDTVTGDDLGTEETGRLLSLSTSAGRSDELDTVQASQATFVLGNHDGKITPGAASPGAPYTGNVVPGRRVVLLADVAGTLCHRWTGYTTGYSQGLAGVAWSEVSMVCADAFRALARPTMPPPYRAEVVLLDQPATYLPLDEAQGSTSAGNIAGAGGTAPMLTTKYGPGGSAFGAGPVLMTLTATTGHTADNDAKALNFNTAATLATGGPADVLDLSALPATYPTSSTPWTFGFWLDIGPTVPTWTGILYRSGKASNNNSLTGFQIEVSTAGRIVIKTASETCITSFFHYEGSGSWLYWVSYNPTAGPFGTVRLFVPDAEEDTSYACTASPFSFGVQPDAAFIGAAWQTLTREATFPAKVLMGNLAFWPSLVSDTRARAERTVGIGGFAETEGNRVGGVLHLAGWPDEDTRIDVGLTMLLLREWAPTNPLTLIQQVAAQGNAVVLMDAAGKVTMQNRRRRINAATVATFAGSAGTAAEEDYSPVLDDVRIRNVITIARTLGATVTITVPASIDRYGRAAPPSSTTMSVASDAEVAAAAEYQALRYSSPDVRVAQISLALHTASTAPLVVQTLLLEQGDKITLAELPTLAPASSVDYFVERIADSWSANKWTVTLGLSPVSATPGVHTGLQLDSATYGHLDAGNALIY